MSISNALSNALSGLTATSRMAEVVSSNLSNALTDGYGRRRVDLSAASLGTMGAGVRIDGIARITNPGIIADRRLADAGLGAGQRDAQALARLENLIGLPGDQSGLAGRLTALEQAFVTAAADPSSEQRLGQVLSRLHDLSSTIKSQASQIQSMRVEADTSIAKDVDAINEALNQVVGLNRDIAISRNSGGDPSGLIDQRQRAVDKIATIIPIREIMRPNGAIALTTTTGAVLLDRTAAVIGFTPAATITADMTLASGGLSGLTFNGAPVPSSDGIWRLNGGSLGAAFKMRDQTLPNAQAGLDEIAADIISRFADPAVDPSIGVGGAGLLTDAGSPHDPLDIIGLSARIAVNVNVDPVGGGMLSRLRDGVNATTPGPIGLGPQLGRWIDALAVPQTAGGTMSRSASGHVADFNAKISTTRVNSDESLGFNTARWEVLRQSELAEGVDSDFELQMLMRIEQAYAANAKVIQAIDAMMQRLTEL